MNKIIGCLMRSIPLATLIIAIGYGIVFFILNNPQKLDFTLFVLGTIPIVIFLPSVLNQSKSGALHTPKVILEIEEKGRISGKSLGKKSPQPIVGCYVRKSYFPFHRSGF